MFLRNNPRLFLLIFRCVVLVSVFGRFILPWLAFYFLGYIFPGYLILLLNNFLYYAFFRFVWKYSYLFFGIGLRPQEYNGLLFKENDKRLRSSIRIVTISDIHNNTSILKNLPKGDMIICTGDITLGGKMKQIRSFAEKWRKLKYQYKILIAGNHDFCFDSNLDNENCERAKELFHEPEVGMYYLQNELIEVEGIKIFGSPFSVTPGTSMAFSFTPKYDYDEKRSIKLRNFLETFPPCDILVTHGPPKGERDYVCLFKSLNCGSQILMEMIEKRIKPKVHIFGHIHEAFGYSKRTIDNKEVLFINCSKVDLMYRSRKETISFDYYLGEDEKEGEEE